MDDEWENNREGRCSSRMKRRVRARLKWGYYCHY